jgi:hypothetical protein
MKKLLFLALSILLISCQRENKDLSVSLYDGVYRYSFNLNEYNTLIIPTKSYYYDAKFYIFDDLDYKLDSVSYESLRLRERMTLKNGKEVLPVYYGENSGLNYKNIFFDVKNGNYVIILMGTNRIDMGLLQYTTDCYYRKININKNTNTEQIFNKITVWDTIYLDGIGPWNGDDINKLYHYTDEIWHTSSYFN